MRSFTFGRATLVRADCLEWLAQQEECSIHGVVTDPPYGLKEYQPDEQERLRAGDGHGGVWRIPPNLDGRTRSPVPRFTILKQAEKEELRSFFTAWGELLLPALTPGAHVMAAGSPLLIHHVASALEAAGLEPRGAIVRVTHTLRGGDRPKGAHERYEGVTVMPRSAWEPWVLVRRPISERSVAANLDRWGTGGLMRNPDCPFTDMVHAGPARLREKEMAPHPTLKPQKLMRHLVRAILPLGSGVVLDPFAGSGSTLAAAEAVGYRSIGVERDREYFKMAKKAIPELAKLSVPAVTRSK